jgi:uncharacterized membrane protein
MKSTIVFFDNQKNSNKGLLRGLVIIPFFFVLTLIWLLFTKKSLYDKHIDKVSNSRLYISMAISSILIVSALGVHTPNTLQKAVVYAGLVGLVIYGVTNSVLISTSNKWDYSIAIIDTLWGICSTSLLGFILYIIVKKWPHIFASSKSSNL